MHTVLMYNSIVLILIHFYYVKSCRDNKDATRGKEDAE